MSITREFNLFLNAGAASPLAINVNQYDQGEVWVFTLYSEKGIQYTPSTGAIVGIKSDNLGIINTATVDGQGRVVVNETQQMTAAVGKATFELTIDSGTHGTANFHVLVEPKPGNNADLSDSDLSLIQEALNAVSPLPTGGTVGQVLTKTAQGSAWSDAGTPTQAQVAEAVSDWADENITVETGVVIDQSLSVSGAAADAKKTGDEISELKSQIAQGSSITDKFTELNGEIALPTIESGLVYVNEGALVYVDASNRLRMKEGVGLELQQGDTIRASAPDSYKYRIAYTTDGGSTYQSTGWYANTSLIPANGTYYLSFSKQDDSRITDTEKELIINSFSLYRPQNALADIDTLKEVTGALADVEAEYYDGYYTASGTVVSTTENGVKYSSKILCFSGMKIRFTLNFISSDHPMWIATGEWKTDGSFLRTTIFSGQRNDYEFVYEPNDDVEFVSFMFYGQNDYTLSLTAFQSIYDVYTGVKEYTDDLIANAKASYAFDSHLTKGINHRGFNGSAPENTMPAFKLSVENGFSFVETDVRFTSDNVPVLLHDATVNRTSNGTGNIADMTYAQARALDFGSWFSESYAGTKIPSFEEFIVFCRNAQIFPYIEISGTYTNAQLLSLYDMVKQYGMTRAVTWISFNANNLKVILSADKGARVCRLHGEAMTEAIASEADGLKTGMNHAFVSIDYRYANTSAVTICKAHDLPLEAWTINSADLIASLPTYVSGATSDSINFETVVRNNALA